MYLSLVYDDILLNCILPYLDYKSRYNLSVVDKYFAYIFRVYRRLFKQKDEEIYFYIVGQVKNNIIYNLQMFLDLLFDISISLNDRIYGYNSNLENGIYYYSKTFYLYPLSIRSYNLYLIIFVKNKQHKTKIFKYYYTGYIDEEEIDYMNLKLNEKVIKLV